MENEFEYYLIQRSGDQAYPLVKPDPESRNTRLYLNKFFGIEIPEPGQTAFTFAKPIPKKPVIGDYFSEPESIVSGKIKNAMEPFDIKGIQIIPAVVSSDKGDVYEGYYYIHIHNLIEAMDKDPAKSRYEQLSSCYTIWNFSLDIDTLKEIPLEERLVFRLDEDISKKLYHKSVAEAIMAANPTGVKFTKVEEWSL